MLATALTYERKSIAFKHILMATDFSPASERALDFAVAIARRYGSALSIVHAVRPEAHERIPIGPLPHELDRQKLDAEEQMRLLGKNPSVAGLESHLLLERGDVWKVLEAAIQLDNVDLLVLGTHGRGGLRKLALGSVAEQVLRLAPCPVLTVGPRVRPARSGATRFGRILFATDFGQASAKAFPYAVSLAEDYQSELFLLHVIPPPPATDMGPAPYGPSSYAVEAYIEWQRSKMESSKARLRQLIPLNNKLAVEPECIVGANFLPEEIIATVAAKKIDLIVMGANRSSTPRVVAHIPGSSTHEVICHASCPVLTVIQ
jgi:nucleotide-binding universal stress UspA family protein